MTFQPIPCVPRDLPDRTVLTLPSDVDLSNASPLYAHIVAVARARRPRLLVLDLTGTRFMDSQGARLIEDVADVLRPHTRVRVVAPPDGLPHRVLTLTGVRRDVAVYGDRDEALTR